MISGREERPRDQGGRRRSRFPTGRCGPRPEIPSETPIPDRTARACDQKCRPRSRFQAGFGAPRACALVGSGLGPRFQIEKSDPSASGAVRNPDFQPNPRSRFQAGFGAPRACALVGSGLGPRFQIEKSDPSASGAVRNPDFQPNAAAVRPENGPTTRNAVRDRRGTMPKRALAWDWEGLEGRTHAKAGCSMGVEEGENQKPMPMRDLAWVPRGSIGAERSKPPPEATLVWNEVLRAVPKGPLARAETLRAMLEGALAWSGRDGERVQAASRPSASRSPQPARRPSPTPARPSR